MVTDWSNSSYPKRASGCAAGTVELDHVTLLAVCHLHGSVILLPKDMYI